jgi:uncharacterized protein YndB with AHSA1/START domain
MSDQLLEVNTQLRITVAANEVYEAIVDPDLMSGYFISSGSARLDSGQEITWQWAEVDIEATVRPQKIEQAKLISFLWFAGSKEGLVTITLKELEEHATLVQINESGWVADEQGIKRCIEETQGWMHMLCCLKAYLEHGINLRSGGIYL